MVNTLSNLVLLAHLAPAMADRGGGHVTAIASLAGLVGMPLRSALQREQGGPRIDRGIGARRARAAGDHLHRRVPRLRGHADVPRQRIRKPSGAGRWQRLREATGATYPVGARDAAERIYMATLRRRETLAFPATRACQAEVVAMPCRRRFATG